MARNEDTIVALATAPGAAAIAVIRVSGTLAIHIVSSHFQGRVKLESVRTQSVVRGTLVGESGEAIDEVMVTVYRAPRSYTGEDVVEISCHGGQVIVGAILDALCRKGARLAEAGEYTRRSFLNGKMDLSQAEAVMEMISAQSRASERAAFAQLEGKLGKKVEELRGSLTSLCALLELELDFSEEALELVGSDVTLKRLETAALELETLASSYVGGKRVRDGLSVVLTGKPNAGKSSLFNALLKESRAIVTAIPGTTRDTLEESIEVGGYLFRLLDTAGIRPTNDPIEVEGVERSLRAKRGADVLCIVEDPFDQNSTSELQVIQAHAFDSQTSLRVISKCDLLDEPQQERLLESLPKTIPTMLVSAKTGYGLGTLEKALCTIMENGASVNEPYLLINKRHYESFRKAGEILRSAAGNWKKSPSNELVVIDVREAANCLGEITGSISSEDILNSIFGHFCIGK